MGSSPSREMQAANGEKARVSNVHEPELSSKGSQQPENPDKGVKRKRGGFSTRKLPRKKLKFSPSPPSPPLSTFDKYTPASENDGHQGAEEVFSNGIHEFSSKPPSGMLTPIPKGKRKDIQARGVRPRRAAETPAAINGEERKSSECDDDLSQSADQKRQRSGTGGNARGAFSDEEKASLTRFKRRFCTDYAVSEYDFNTLMTLLGRRDRSEWPNPDVTRAELRDMFYNVLPDRSRKSMNRYRERYFQNTEQDTEWTAEQMKELRDLVKEKGRRWVEIAELLGRTQDSVYQKWKNRIRQGDSQRFARWEDDEREALISAVRDCKIAAGVPLDFSSDDKVNWTVVSDRLGLKRNAQQCSTFWKRVYRPREEAKARGEDVKPLPAGRSKSEYTYPRRQSRRKVTKGRKSVDAVTGHRRIKSGIYVAESDDNDGHSVSAHNTRPEGKKTLDCAPEGDGPLQDLNSLESAEVESQGESKDDENEKYDGDRGRSGSPTKKLRQNRMIAVNLHSPATRTPSPDLQSGPTTQLNGSFRAINRHPHEPQQSSKQSHTHSSPERESAAPQSSFADETPRLPPPKRTPQQVASLTQAFNNTQAPTSARMADHATPSTHTVEERPSPDIEVRSTLWGGDGVSLILEGDNEAEQEQGAWAATPETNFAIHESEAQNRNDEQTSQVLSSPTPLMAGSGSGAESDSESHSQCDEGRSHMLSYDALVDAHQPFRAESGVRSQLHSELTQNETDAEAEESSELSATPPPIFSSAAPQVLNNVDGLDSETDYSDDDGPPQMFSSAAVPDRSEQPSETDSDTEEDEDDEMEEGEGGKEAEEEQDENEDQPPKIFTSAIPDHNVTQSSSPLRRPSPRLSQPVTAATLDERCSSPPSAENDSSDDAVTIPPYDSDRSGFEEASDDLEDDDGGKEDDRSPFEGTKGDFFANLEASAKKVRWQEQVTKKRRADVGGWKREREGKTKSVFDVSDSSGGSSGDEEAHR